MLDTMSPLLRCVSSPSTGHCFVDFAWHLDCNCLPTNATHVPTSQAEKHEVARSEDCHHISSNNAARHRSENVSVHLQLQTRVFLYVFCRDIITALCSIRKPIVFGSRSAWWLFHLSACSFARSSSLISNLSSRRLFSSCRLPWNSLLAFGLRSRSLCSSASGSLCRSLFAHCFFSGLRVAGAEPQRTPARLGSDVAALGRGARPHRTPPHAHDIHSDRGLSCFTLPPPLFPPRAATSSRTPMRVSFRRCSRYSVSPARPVRHLLGSRLFPTSALLCSNHDSFLSPSLHPKSVACPLHFSDSTAFHSLLRLAPSFRRRAIPCPSSISASRSSNSAAGGSSQEAQMLRQRPYPTGMKTTDATSTRMDLVFCSMSFLTRAAELAEDSEHRSYSNLRFHHV